jgi:predicted ABC-type ATPase
MADPVLHLLAGPNGSGKYAYEAADLAAARRQELIVSRSSYATETVFSHESKVELVRTAVDAGYLVTLRVIAVPEDLAVDRVENRVENGGHAVPESKVRERYGRLWAHVADAIRLAEHSRVYDNTTGASPFRLIAEFERGALLWSEWPSWVPEELSTLT